MLGVPLQGDNYFDKFDIEIWEREIPYLQTTAPLKSGLLVENQDRLYY